MSFSKLVCAAAVASLSISAMANAQVRITEFMYSGTDGEFFEITNLGALPVDLTGWSYDDDSQTAGTFDLSALGTLGAGESAVVAETDEATFKSAWSLTTTKVLGSLTTNLGRNDEINIYDNLSALVDRLTFGDQNLPGTIRTQNASGWAIVSGAGPYGNVDANWKLSSIGDVQNSYSSTGLDVGSPGMYSVPEPATLTALLAGAAGLVRRRR